MDNKKYIFIIIILSLVAVITGLSYAWFSAILTGNETAHRNTVTTGDLKLTYNDGSEMSLSNAFPGDSFNKTITIKNEGTINTYYNLVWQELTNGIINNELVIEATCKKLNSSNVEEGTCEDLSQTPILSLDLKTKILIEPNYTHQYTVKVTFIDTGLPQNYNKRKSFTGKLGIEEYKSTPFREESWSTIALNVRNGNVDKYNVGDIREVDLGNYGIHKVILLNKATPSECSVSNYSQTACGFVIGFVNAIAMSKMNTTAKNVGGWPSSEAYTLLNTTIYGSLSDELKSVILDTKVISGHGSTSGESNFTSTDKFYLLSPTEIYEDYTSNTSSNYDTAKDLTRQLDYYKSVGTKMNSVSTAIKKEGTNAVIYWLRTANSSNNTYFYFVNIDGNLFTGSGADYNLGISPAFRIG